MSRFIKVLQTEVFSEGSKIMNRNESTSMNLEIPAPPVANFSFAFNVFDSSLAAFKYKGSLKYSHYNL